MAKRLSSGMVDFISQEGGITQALSNGVIRFYTGSQPATADAAATGTLLCTFTKASGTLTAETRAACRVVVSADAGSVDSILVAGLPLIGSAVTCGGVQATHMADLVSAINNYSSSPDFKAVASGGSYAGVTYGTGTAGEFFIIAPKNSGDIFNALNIVFNTTVTQITLNGGAAGVDRTGSFAATVGTGHSGNTAVVGVTAANGLNFTFPNASAGVAVKEATSWTGVAVATGAVGWFRFSGDSADPTVISTEAIRMDGSVGTSGTDLIVSSTAITTGATQTVNTFTLNMLTAQ